MVTAPIRLANCRSAAGGMASSLLATRYQHGSDFHAGSAVTSVKAEPASACWIAKPCLTRFPFTSSTSKAVIVFCVAPDAALQAIDKCSQGIANFAQDPQFVEYPKDRHIKNCEQER
jgi:hypothetical protein